MKVGDRVKVFRTMYFVDDIKTPLSVTMCTGTVSKIRNTPDMWLKLSPLDWREIDIQLDSGTLTKSHFAWGINRLHPQHFAEGAD